jgi:sporulation protein YlmC with PRC-barrel domain
MKSATIRQRSEILGTQVITRDTGKRLGVVSQLWVDVDAREVVAIGMRDSFLAMGGMPQYMLLKNVRQIGDVILVDDERVVEDNVDIEAYSKLTSSEVITETGELLGKVRSFQFDIETGKVESIVIDSLGFPQVPDQIVSTYELSMDEIVSSGPDRLIVFEGAEEHLTQLTVGVLERFGIGAPPWEREDLEDYYTPATRPENQLGTGAPTRREEPVRTTARTEEPVWDDQDWEEREPKVAQTPAEAVYYEEDEADNWSEATEDEYRRSAPREAERYTRAEYQEEVAYEEDVEPEAGESERSQRPNNRPRVNIPQKIKRPEYEEEPEY